MSSTEQARWFSEQLHPHEPALRAYLGVQMIHEALQIEGDALTAIYEDGPVPLSAGPANHLRQGYGGQEAGHHIDSSVRALATVSLFLWAGAIVAGRLMAYL